MIVSQIEKKLRTKINSRQWTTEETGICRDNNWWQNYPHKIDENDTQVHASSFCSLEILKIIPTRLLL